MLAVLFLLLGFFALVRADCQDGYTYSTYTNKCYKFVSHRNANFMAAQSLCEAEAGNLASIQDEEENAFIQNALGLYSVWHFIGIDLLSLPHAWTDGSAINYTNWAPGEPSSGPCAIFNSIRGQWGTYDCNLPLPYICKTSPSSPAQNCPNITTASPVTCPLPAPVSCPPPPACPTIPPPISCPTVTTRPPLTCPPPPACPTTKPPVACTVPTTRPPPTCPPPKPPCETDWTYLASTKSCYFTYWGAAWTTAESNCKSRGGHLASIHSDEENNLVYLLGKSGYGGDYPSAIWIGLYKSGGQWIWSDGTPVDYGRWSAGEPNNMNGNEGCVELYTDPINGCGGCSLTRWNDYKCGYTLRAFVCKKRALV